MSRYPERIVCLTEETTETLYMLGQGDRVVGIWRIHQCLASMYSE
jgi:iron complex transport system substrate-binding protein